jgi:phosphate transport system permease protein
VGVPPAAPPPGGAGRGRRRAPPPPPAAARQAEAGASADEDFDFSRAGYLHAGGRFRLVERVIESLLFLAGSSSILITLGIVGILAYEASTFFEHVGLRDFLTDTQWTPLFEDAHYGILPLLAGTVVTTVVGLCVAIPVGTVCAIWLSEYAPKKLREVIKPALELLGAVPTVVYGYFALLFVTPLLQRVIPGLPGFNMLSAGLVIGLMIIPYVSSLSEDAMHAVPMQIREGSYATGATRMQTALRVVVPSSFSGITAAYILGVSRAVGETMVVAIAAGTQPNLTADPTQPGATITAYIVQVSLGDLPHGSIGYQSIFAAGLALLVLTLAFNIGGYLLRKRYRQAY